MFALTVMAYFEGKRQGMNCSSYDMAKFIDFEDIFYVKFELSRSSIRGKLYRLSFEMNKNLGITAQTTI